MISRMTNKKRDPNEKSRLRPELVYTGLQWVIRNAGTGVYKILTAKAEQVRVKTLITKP